jgi:hypothetical protein
VHGPAGDGQRDESPLAQRLAQLAQGRRSPGDPSVPGGAEGGGPDLGLEAGPAPPQARRPAVGGEGGLLQLRRDGPQLGQRLLDRGVVRRRDRRLSGRPRPLGPPEHRRRATRLDGQVEAETGEGLAVARDAGP